MYLFFHFIMTSKFFIPLEYIFCLSKTLITLFQQFFVAFQKYFFFLEDLRRAWGLQDCWRLLFNTKTPSDPYFAAHHSHLQQMPLINYSIFATPLLEVTSGQRKTPQSHSGGTTFQMQKVSNWTQWNGGGFLYNRNCKALKLYAPFTPKKQDLLNYFGLVSLVPCLFFLC